MRIALGPLDEFPPGSCRILDVDGTSIGIFNRGGELYAVRNLCPHRLAPICRGSLGGTFLPTPQGEWEYAHDGFILRCVAHGWEFDIRTGDPVANIDPRRVKTYPVSVEAGEVTVELRPGARASGV